MFLLKSYNKIERFKYYKYITLLSPLFPQKSQDVLFCMTPTLLGFVISDKKMKETTANTTASKTFDVSEKESELRSEEKPYHYYPKHFK